MPIDAISEARTFVLVVEGGSLSAAARALQVSPNAVSQRIRAIERRAGVRLLNRTTRAMSVTEEGQALYRRCLRIVAEVDGAEADLASSPAQVSGRVRLALPTALATSPTLRALAALHTQHPGLHVQVLVSDRLADGIGAGIDLAIHYGEPPESGLIARRLGTTAFGLCATSAYLDERGRPPSPADLAEHDGLRFLSDLPQGTWTLIGPDGREIEVSIGGWFESDSSRVLGDAVDAGLGIGVRSLPEIAASDALEAVLPDYRFGDAPLVALMPPGRHRLARVRAVLDALTAVFTETVLDE